MADGPAPRPQMLRHSGDRLPRYAAEGFPQGSPRDRIACRVLQPAGHVLDLQPVERAGLLARRQALPQFPKAQDQGAVRGDRRRLKEFTGKLPDVPLLLAGPEVEGPGLTQGWFCSQPVVCTPSTEELMLT